MKIYQTNAGLGYNEFAYLIKLNKSEIGYNYLCIGTKHIIDTDIYVVGKIIENLEDLYVEDSEYTIDKSPLYGTYLFDYFCANYDENFDSLYYAKNSNKKTHKIIDLFNKDNNNVIFIGTYNECVNWRNNQNNNIGFHIVHLNKDEI